ncbi:MAG: hypothetical protein ACRCS9_14330 [Hyphomicrobium sp.]
MTPARADDAYLCGTDKVVYVPIDKLEEMKRTDPCIASHFGVTLDAKPAAKDETVLNAQPVQGLNAGKASRSTPGTNAGAGTAIQFKSLDAPEAEQTTRRAPQRSAELMPPRAAPNTDYRNIRVLNARSAEDAWFRHGR